MAGAPYSVGAVTSANRRRQADILLALAAGLVLVGLARVLPASLSSIAGVVTLLALGAVVRHAPWRTGALAAAPAVVAGLVRAAGESLSSVAVIVVLAPLLVAICALVVKGGGYLVDRRSDAAGPTDEDGSSGGRRWRPFETKAQRGRFLVIVAVLVVVGGGLLSTCSGDQADRVASRRAEEIRVALEGRSPASLQTGLAMNPELPGGPYRVAAVIGDSFEATVEIRRGLQFRCIRVHLGVDGRVSTDINHKRCGG